MEVSLSALINHDGTNSSVLGGLLRRMGPKRLVCDFVSVRPAESFS